MIERLVKKIGITATAVDEKQGGVFENLPAELSGILNAYAGSTFGNGLYRLHSFQSSFKWAGIIGDYFTEYKNKILPFGFDWMGRQFCAAINDKRLFMFDPATAEDFEIDQTLVPLHNEDFADDTDEMLAVNMFDRILAHNKMSSLNYDQCLGFKIPLFLGGEDSIGNYEAQDMEVYWHINGEIVKKTKDLPDGTIIGKVEIE
ncbi:DUF1851 domain-containing protein [Chitinophaga lutea]|uniref:DUF1851 domain-containing protein n=1 Tax=Chitinophaga lutea TaxID=2488634 RepID=A0A3N4PJA8_9BACT|nr:T6SS immunity protein Tdi1 domain-containing protein [Chitinophaga lutea]RPE08306.1 DUF1851 domain-containing protein [Chitinophaga lutea]